jgi:hypothetical protein
MSIYSKSPLRNDQGVMARAAVWIHMKECGMSIEEIAKAFGKSVKIIKGPKGLGLRFRFSHLDREIIKMMPKIQVREEVKS